MGFIELYFKAMMMILCLCLVAWLFSNPIGWAILVAIGIGYLIKKNTGTAP